MSKFAFPSWLSVKANTKVAKLILLNTRNKNVAIAKAPWYKVAVKELGLELNHQIFRKRNVVERSFMPLKRV